MTNSTDSAEMHDLTCFVSSPAEQIADALLVCEVREHEENPMWEGLATTQELPAVPMAELVAASTYKDEELAIRMWERAIDHIGAEPDSADELRLFEELGTLPGFADPKEGL